MSVGTERVAGGRQVRQEGSPTQSICPPSSVFSVCILCLCMYLYLYLYLQVGSQLDRSTNLVEGGRGEKSYSPKNGNFECSDSSVSVSVFVFAFVYFHLWVGGKQDIGSPAQCNYPPLLVNWCLYFLSVSASVFVFSYCGCVA